MTGINVNLGMTGEWQLDVYNIFTKERRSAGRFKNLITNSGKDLIATSSYLTTCQVGSGNTTPAAGQTALVALVDTTTNIQSSTYSSSPTAPYFFRVTKVFEFAARTSNVNLSEIAIAGSTLVSRALIKDISGNPTTLSLIVGDVLVATYIFTEYLLNGDTVLTGVTLGTWTGNTTIRNAYATIANPNFLGEAFNKRPPGDTAFPSISSVGGGRFYNGALGAETSIPAGTTADFNTELTLFGSYVAGSYTRTLRLICPSGKGNLAGGVSAVAITTSLGAFQFGFSPALPKTTDNVLTLDFIVSWDNAA